MGFCANISVEWRIRYLHLMIWTLDPIDPLHSLY